MVSEFKFKFTKFILNKLSRTKTGSCIQNSQIAMTNYTFVAYRNQKKMQKYKKYKKYKNTENTKIKQ